MVRDEIDIQDTLELANDYVNIEDFEEFRAKYQDTLAPDVMEYLDEHKDHRELWKGVPIPEMVKYSSVTDVQVNTSTVV